MANMMGQMPLPRLTKTHLTTSLLGSQDTWEVVEEGFEEPNDTTDGVNITHAEVIWILGTLITSTIVKK